MGQLEDMQLFIHIVDSGSITKAALQLNLAKSAVSRRLSQLEQQLNTQLIARTTRQFSLTDSGRHYYQQANQILHNVEQLNNQLSHPSPNLSGSLKLALPLSFGLLHLSPLINQYAQQHPELILKLHFSDRKVDLIKEGYELAIRIGHLKDSSYHAKPLCPIHFSLCASPQYLKQHGTPNTLAELQRHNFLQYGYHKHPTLTLIDPQQNIHTLNLKSKINANNGDFLLQMALNHHGIAYLPTFLSHRAIANNQLQHVLPHYQFPSVKAYALYPSNRYLLPQSRLLIEHLSQQLGDPPYWDRSNQS